MVPEEILSKKATDIIFLFINIATVHYCIFLLFIEKKYVIVILIIPDLHLILLVFATGYASLLGWESGITWDGVLVSPLLTDECPHMLVLLHAARPVVSVTVSVRQRDRHRTLTFTAGATTIKLDHILSVCVDDLRHSV